MFFYMHHSPDRITHTTAFVTPVVEHNWNTKGNGRLCLEHYIKNSIIVCFVLDLFNLFVCFRVCFGDIVDFCFLLCFLLLFVLFFYYYLFLMNVKH